MKKIKLFAMLSAFITLTLTSCTDDEESAAQNPGRTITITAENPDVEKSTRTEVGLDTDGRTIIPMWSKEDIIFASVNMNQKPETVKCPRVNNDGSSKTATFSMPLAVSSQDVRFFYKNNHEYIKDSYMSGENILFSYKVENSLNIIEKNNEIKGDFMSARPVHIDESTQNVNVRFKRCVSVIKLTVKDPSDVIGEGKMIESIDIMSDDRLGSSFVSVLSPNEEFQKTAVKNQDGNLKLSFKYFKNNPEDMEGDRGIYVKNLKDIYFATAPMKLTEGQKIKFTVNITDNKGNVYPSIEKTVTAGPEGIEFAIGKLNTINLNISEDTQNPGNKGIVTTAAGQIKAEMLETAIVDKNTIKVTGPVNNADIGVITGWISDDRVSIVDLRDAEISGNALASNSFYYDVRFGNKEKDFTIYFPNSLERIETGAVTSLQMHGNTHLVFGPKVKLFDTECINLMYNGSIKILSKNDSTNIKDNFAVLARRTSNVTLCIYQGWRNEIFTGMTEWRGISWSAITFCDENGNKI